MSNASKRHVYTFRPAKAGSRIKGIPTAGHYLEAGQSIELPEGVAAEYLDFGLVRAEDELAAMQDKVEESIKALELAKAEAKAQMADRASFLAELGRRPAKLLGRVARSLGSRARSKAQALKFLETLDTAVITDAIEDLED